MADMAEKIGELKGKAEVKADEIKMKAGEIKGKAEAKLDEMKKDHEDKSELFSAIPTPHSSPRNITFRGLLPYTAIARSQTLELGRDLDGLHTRLGLVARLLPFGGGHRIKHKPRAGLHTGLMVADERGTNRDRHVHVAGEIEVADRTAIDATVGGLELVDDLHRARLGRSGQRARGEC